MTHNWYAVVTAKVLMAKDISSTQKLLVALISNLSNDRGYCFASNKYLAECLDINPVTISKNITDLEEKGYISRIVKINPITKQVEERVLIIIEHPNPGEIIYRQPEENLPYEKLNCASCGERMYVLKERVEVLRRNGYKFYCTQGHTNYFTKEG